MRSPRAKAKARAWKAWAVESAHPGRPVLLTVTSPFNGERVQVYVLFQSRDNARRYFGGRSGEFPATILPAPRARKSKGAKR